MFLDAIVQSVDERVQALRPRMAELEAGVKAQGPVRSLKAALSAGSGALKVIAECKQKSPSKGWLTDHYDPVHQALGYEHDGASAISVLTEPHYFAGDLTHMEQVRAAVSLPVLRKDFVRDPVQLLEARAHGADAALLIVRIVDDARLEALYQTAQAIGLEVLVEIHSAAEAERAMRLNPAIIGVNNRDLDSFETRLVFSEEMARTLPAETVRVSESGIQTVDDLDRVKDWGYQAVLVGESLMRGSGLLRNWTDVHAH